MNEFGANSHKLSYLVSQFWLLSVLFCSFCVGLLLCWCALVFKHICFCCSSRPNPVSMYFEWSFVCRWLFFCSFFFGRSLHSSCIVYHFFFFRFGWHCVYMHFMGFLDPPLTSSLLTHEDCCLLVFFLRFPKIHFFPFWLLPLLIQDWIDLTIGVYGWRECRQFTSLLFIFQLKPIESCTKF